VHATNDHQPAGDIAALVSVADELDASIAAHLDHDGPALAVRSRVPRVLRTTVVVDDGAFAVQLDDGPPVPLAPVAEPGRAAARVGRMLAAGRSAR